MYLTHRRFLWAVWRADPSPASEMSRLADVELQVSGVSGGARPAGKRGRSSLTALLWIRADSSLRASPQLIMQYLDTATIFRLARLNSYMLGLVRSPFAWKCAAPLRFRFTHPPVMGSPSGLQLHAPMCIEWMTHARAWNEPAEDGEIDALVELAATIKLHEIDASQRAQALSLPQWRRILTDSAVQTHLRVLTIVEEERASQCSGQILELLPALPKLHSFHASEIAAPSDVWRLIASSCPSLTSLRLKLFERSTKALEHISLSPSVRHLHIEGPAIYAAGEPWLPLKMPALTSLTLEGFTPLSLPVTQDLIAPAIRDTIESLPALTSLVLRRTTMTHLLIPCLDQAHALRRLDIYSGSEGAMPDVRSLLEWKGDGLKLSRS